jgi:hypothetical protein
MLLERRVVSDMRVDESEFALTFITLRYTPRMVLASSFMHAYVVRYRIFETRAIAYNRTTSL